MIPKNYEKKTPGFFLVPFITKTRSMSFALNVALLKPLFTILLWGYTSLSQEVIWRIFFVRVQ